MATQGTAIKEDELTMQERKVVAAALDELRASVELALRPGSELAQSRFNETGRTALFRTADLLNLKAAARVLRGGQ